ncbi:MAG: pesticidal protein Cry7Aa [Flaviaesturariibacter sp.]|nr:pesticidal protein Cry7Aa [Flaviaesturariibacter sp.]
MIDIKKEGILLKKRALAFEEEGVLNPAVIREGGQVHMFYRAVGKGNYSSVGYCKLNGPLTIEDRLDSPLLIPEYDYESHGVEDPRIVKIENLYYLTYTAYDGVNALGCLAVSKDLVHFKKKGIIAPQVGYDEFRMLAETHGAINQKYLRYNEQGQVAHKQGKPVLLWDKNLIFFPRRINSKLYFLHRIKPDIQIAAINDIDELTAAYWHSYFLELDNHILLSPKLPHEISYVGGGCPPIETEHGWLLIYHSVYDTVKGYVYCACAALLDLENPGQELCRLPYALFQPEHDWELNGEVNNVCFPTGAALFGDTLYVYYGAADEQIAVASMSFSSLLNELLLYKKADKKTKHNGHSHESSAR